MKQGASGRRPRKTAAAPSAADVMGATVREEPVDDDLRLRRTGHSAARETAAPAVQAAAPATGRAAAPTGAKPLAKPPVRKLAKDLGVDLAWWSPTGPDGTVTREDVARGASGTQTAAAPHRRRRHRPGRRALLNGERRVPIKGVRKATAAAMVQSAFTAPHVTEFLTVDVTPTMEFVQRLKEMPDFEGVRVSPLLLVAKAFLVAWRGTRRSTRAGTRQPARSSTCDHVNLGIAAATPRGLMVPNIKGADLLPLVELGRALNKLTDVAREGKTSLADMTGGTVDHHQRRRLRRGHRHPDPQPRRSVDPGVRRGAAAAVDAQGQGEAAPGDHARRCPSTTAWSTASWARRCCGTSARCSRTR